MYKNNQQSKHSADVWDTHIITPNISSGSSLFFANMMQLTSISASNEGFLANLLDVLKRCHNSMKTFILEIVWPYNTVRMMLMYVYMLNIPVNCGS